MERERLEKLVELDESDLDAKLALEQAQVRQGEKRVSYTEAELVAMLEKADKDRAFGYTSDLEIKITADKYAPKQNAFDIKFTTMYEYVEISLDALQAVSDIFKTRNINVGHKEYYSGCDTCDYGSSYELHLTVQGSPIVLTD